MKTKNALEWIVFAVSALLIAAVLFILVLEARDMGETPPLLRVATGAAEETAGAFRIPVSVHNAGDETAEQAEIEVELIGGDGRVVERSQLTIAFVPKRSVREGWVTFHRDPRCCRIVTRAAAFTKP